MNKIILLNCMAILLIFNVMKKTACFQRRFHYDANYSAGFDLCSCISFAKESNSFMSIFSRIPETH